MPGYKRLYRDSDNRILGGVCSGLGAYWNVDPILLRILFIFLFFGIGTGFLLYLILWIAIPKAVTLTEKMEMRGEPITAENIGKNYTSTQK
jgi:phage shock protein C